MHSFVVFVIVSSLVSFVTCIQTKSFLANENRQGYDEKLLIKTIRKHFPDADISDMRVLARIVSSEKGQLVLRNAAVKEMKKKIESEQGRKTLDEPLEDESYCKYDWLSWLPWLSCPKKAKKITPLRYYEKICH